MWPIRGVIGGGGPCKFVFADEEDQRVGSAVDSIVGSGTIISGGQVDRSVVFNNVRVNSFSRVTESILFPGVSVGRNARLRRCIIDKGVRVPPGAVIGEDPDRRSRALHRERGRRRGGDATGRRSARRVRRRLTARRTRAAARRKELRLLFASWELAPLAQTGGLGDMASGLARALAARGHAVTCVLPAHRDVLQHPACPALTDAGAARIAVPGGDLAGRWLAGELDGLQLQLLDLPVLYDRPHLYGGADVAEALRYIALSRAVAEFAATTRPQVLIAHDWHAALALCALRIRHDFGAARGVGAVQVVHNNAFLGRFPAEAFPATGLPDSLFHPDALEFWGDISVLKAGLAFADRIVAVSPTYAKELQTPAFGEGLEGLYAFRAHRLLGIANGIDTTRHDPAIDGALPARLRRRVPEAEGKLSRSAARGDRTGRAPAGSPARGGGSARRPEGLGRPRRRAAEAGRRRRIARAARRRRSRARCAAA